MDQKIRFITTKYDDLFQLPDGGVVEVTFPDRHFFAKCRYVDDYHFKLGAETLHICEFATILEQRNGICRPEAETSLEQAAWKIERHGFLLLQTSEEGYDYSLYDLTLHELDGGQLDNPHISMNQARNDILEDLGWDNRIMKLEPYDVLSEQISHKLEAEIPKRRESVLQKLSSKNPEDAGHAGHIHTDKTR